MIKITININSNPIVLSQMFKILAWVYQISQHKGISEFKVNIDNSDLNFNFDVDFNDETLNKQFEEYKNLYKNFRTQEINPIFYLNAKNGEVK